MTEHSITVQKAARYYVLGEMNKNTKTIWFVLHGYGQLARYFIKKFEKLVDEHTVVVAPEALSRFYLTEKMDRVGATWMTREDRLNEIEDYLVYLYKVYEALRNQREDLEINVLGFSQGTATALRWVYDEVIKFKKVVIWAGFFGKGIADVVDAQSIADTETHVVYGTKDEYLSQIDIPAYIADIHSIIPHAKIVSFEGTHTIDEETLLKVV